MKKLTALWFFCLFTFGFCLASHAGQWTANGYFYKPSMGASGETEYNLFNQGLDRADAELAALDPSQISASPPLTYNAATGVIALPQASATVSGYLASTDWSTFNAKQPAIAPGTASQYWRGDKTWQLLDAGAANIGEVWVGDPAYGSTIQAAIATINGAAATLHVPAGAYTFPSSYTIPANITLALENGAILTIPIGFTLTINGPFQGDLSQKFSCTGTGQVVFGRPSGVKTLYPQWWGAKGDDVHDDTAALNAMSKCSVASGSINCFCPLGTYKLSDTLQIGYGAAHFISFCFEGASSSRQAGCGTVFDGSALVDRPIINLQSGYYMQFKNFLIQGPNLAPNTAAFPTASPPGPTPDPVPGDWVTSGCQDTQYGPQCGFCIDGYGGAAPASGGYTNAAYGSGWSSGTYLENVNIQNCVAGMVISPNGNQCDDFFSAKDCDWLYNKYGFSSGGTQSDSLNLYNCWIERNWKAIVTSVHGTQDGHCPNMWGGGLQDNWCIFDTGCGYPCTIQGVWAEEFGYLGNFGLYGGGANAPMNFNSCFFSMGSSHEPYFFCSAAPLNFDSCEFNAQQSFSNLNFYGPGTVLVNCGFADFKIGIKTVGMVMYPRPTWQFINTCFLFGGSLQPILNSQWVFDATEYPIGKQYIAPWVYDVKLWGTASLTSYHVTVPPSFGEPYSNFSSTGSDRNLVISFTAFNPSDFAVGDLMWWNVTDRTGQNTFAVPAFQVTAVNQSTGAVSAQSLYDGVTIPSTLPGNLYLVVPTFINGSPATGNSTSGSNQITNVTNIGNFAGKDWIQGTTWRPGDGGRITSIDSTNNILYMSRNATATASGVSLYNCGLVAY